jgi:anti-anti-sigma factor
MLDINIEPRQGILFVRLKGNLNEKSKIKLRREVSSLVKNVGIKNIVFNLNELKEITYDGLKELLKSAEYCKANDGTAFFVAENGKYDNNLKIKNYLINDEKSAVNYINT